MAISLFHTPHTSSLTNAFEQTRSLFYMERATLAPIAPDLPVVRNIEYCRNPEIRIVSEPGSYSHEKVLI